RYQSATDLKTALKRLKRDLDSSARLAAEQSSGTRRAASTEHSIAVLYFENLSGMKEDEYLRDGITEDITTELSKIKGLKTFCRAADYALAAGAASALSKTDRELTGLRSLSARKKLCSSRRTAGSAVCSSDV